MDVCISELIKCYIHDVYLFIICNVGINSNLSHSVVLMEEFLQEEEVVVHMATGGGGPYGNGRWGPAHMGVARN